MGEIQKYLDMGLELIIGYAPKLVLAILTLIIGLKVIKILNKLILNSLKKTNLDETATPFVANFIKWILKFVLLISIASMIGIETTSFVALLGTVGLAVGLALQGTLANFAGGVLLMIFKPYNVGDLVDALGKFGEVKEVQIFNTILLTPENKTVILPNGAVSNSHITNFSKEGKLRVDLTIGISYTSDIKKAKEILIKTMESNPKVLKTPEPMVAVGELADSSINLVVRPWSTPEDYWDVYFGTLEECKNALDAGGINIPFPQMDIFIKK